MTPMTPMTYAKEFDEGRFTTGGLARTDGRGGIRIALVEAPPRTATGKVRKVELGGRHGAE